MKISLNGEPHQLDKAGTVAALVNELGLDTRKVAVEVNLAIVPRSLYGETPVREDDRIEIVQFIGGGIAIPNLFRDLSQYARDAETSSAIVMNDPLIIAGRRFNSRLLVGTGKYKDFAETRAAIEASGAEIVTVALRRVSLAAEKGSIQDFLDPARYTYLPNSAGCHSGEDAVRTLRLAREAGGWTLVKLEVIGDAKTLYPDVNETLRAASILAKEGFEVMAYTSDDPVAARKLEEAGCVAVMPLAAPIGSGLGIQNPLAIRTIVEAARVPVLVDAGVGTASDAAIAMELGCDGVLMNTAIAEAKDPVRMAEAMKHAVIAGRLAYQAGRMAKRGHASASSPVKGTIGKLPASQ